MEIVEILSALRHCTSDLGCDTCPMRAGIEQRAFCVATLLQESKTAIIDLLAGIDAAKRRCAQAQAERDALLEIAKNGKDCDTCKHCKVCVKPGTDVAHWCDRCEEKCRCYGCGGDHWEWRGLPGAPKEGGKHE